MPLEQPTTPLHTCPPVGKCSYTTRKQENMRHEDTRCVRGGEGTNTTGGGTSSTPLTRKEQRDRVQLTERFTQRAGRRVAPQGPRLRGGEGTNTTCGGTSSTTLTWDEQRGRAATPPGCEESKARRKPAEEVAQSTQGRSRRAAGRPCKDALHATIFKSSSTQLHPNQAYPSRDNRTFAHNRSQNESQPTQIISPKANDIDTGTGNDDINAIDDGSTAPGMLQKAVKRRLGSAR